MSGRKRRAVAPDDGLTYVLRYKRVSGDEQKDEGISIPTQDEETLAYLLARASDGWIEDSSYEDVLKGRRDDRPDYQRLLTRARELDRAGKRIAILLFRTDRFGRRLSERTRAWEEFADFASCEIHAVVEGGKQDRLSHNVRALLSEEEVFALSQRVSATRAYVVRHGFRPVGRKPWGYCLRKATPDERRGGSPKQVLDVEPSEALYVAEAWRRRAQGESVHQIAGWLAALPAAARGGRTLDYSTARQLFQSAVYVGRPDLGDVDGDVDVLARPRGKWPALITDEVWAAVAAQAEAGQRLPAQASERYLLTGLLRCWRCGHRMDGRSFLPKASRVRGTNRRRRTYRCIGHLRGAAGRACMAEVPAATVEALLLDQIGRLLDALSGDTVIERVERIERQQSRRDVATTSLAAQIGVQTARVSRARANLTGAAEKLLAGVFGDDDYQFVRDKQLADIRDAEQALAELRGRAPQVRSPVPLQTLLARVDGWATALQQTEQVAEARVALGQLIEFIVPRRVGGKWSRQWAIDVLRTDYGEQLRRLAEALEEHHVGQFGKPNPPTGYSFPDAAAS